MRTCYKTLTIDEYNVLNLISRRTKMDCWFCLKQDKNGIDYVWDLEEERRMCLKTGVGLLVEGIDCRENYNNCWLNCFENLTFRNLLKKLNIDFNVVYDGPSIIGMSKQDFTKYCKENDIKFKKFVDDFLVGDKVFQFNQEEKCFNVVVLNLDKDVCLEAHRELDAQILAAKSILGSKGEDELLRSRNVINTNNRV